MSDPLVDLDAKYLVDPYLNWARGEGAPIAEDVTLDLLTLDVAPWARFDMRGAICHVEGRCDFLAAFLFELAPGARSAPLRHVYEEACVVLSGEGETEIELSDGRRRTIAWGPGQIFAAPINARRRHRNTGASPARFVSLNDLRYLMGLYRNEAFLFANDAPFHARQAKAMEADWTVDPSRVAPGPDELTPLPLADLTLGVDLTALAPGAPSLARRQMQGRHILGLEGKGSTLSFASETSELTRIDWRRGMLAGLAPMRFHQHVATGDAEARFVSVELGSQASPMFRSRRAVYGDTQVYASGAAIVSREAERADVREAVAAARVRTSR